MSKNAFLQDFWVCALLANIVSVAKDEASILVDEAREGKKNLYQHVPNTSDLVASLKDDFVSACLDSSQQKRNKQIAHVVNEISRSVIPILQAEVSQDAPPENPSSILTPNLALDALKLLTLDFYMSYFWILLKRLRKLIPSSLAVGSRRPLLCLREFWIISFSTSLMVI